MAKLGRHWPWKKAQPLAEPLMEPNHNRTPRTLANHDTIVGIAMVTSAALLFGVVAAFVKATALPTLVMLQCRSVIEWVIGFAVALFHARGNVLGAEPLPQAEARLAEKFSETARPQQPHPRPKSQAPPASGGSQSSLALLLVGPTHLWGWLLLRAALYWGFLACWWLALTSMPIGDATTIVYTGPIFTATFARVFLGEAIHWSFYPVIALDFIGVALITQPSFLFPASEHQDQGSGYLLGACSALLSAVIAGLLPVTTRISKECYWTAVNHVSSALSALVFTPLAFAVWYATDDTAAAQTVDSIASLDGNLIDPTSGGLGKLPCLLGATITGFVGLALQTTGYQRTEAAKASVMTILEIPFAYLMQVVLFHDEMSLLGLCGVGFVVTGTSLNLWRHLKASGEASAAS